MHLGPSIHAIGFRKPGGTCCARPWRGLRRELAERVERRIGWFSRNLETADRNKTVGAGACGQRTPKGQLGGVSSIAGPPGLMPSLLPWMAADAMGIHACCVGISWQKPPLQPSPCRLLPSHHLVRKDRLGW